MTGVEIQERLAALSVGARCTRVELYAAESWSFDFEGRFGLNLQSPWRIVSEKGIELGSADDGQKFGLSAPVDAAAVAMTLLASVVLKRVEVKNKTADIAFEFESGLCLEVFNYSTGYEGWSWGAPGGYEVIGLGGGDTANMVPR